MQIRSSNSSNFDEEVNIFIKKRLSFTSGYYSCDELYSLIKDSMKLGIEFYSKWNNCFLKSPNDGTIVILRLSDINYTVCKFSNNKYKDLIKGTVQDIDNQSQWRYLNYPSDRS